MYDAIVVGARCAGSPTAMLLARKGYRVLLVDRGRFPSDMVLSTHCVWPAGIAHLKAWGLLDALRASNCPGRTTIRLDFGTVTLEGTPSPAGDVSETFCPRRAVLDAILVDAAVKAGVDLHEGCLVTGLQRDGERVTGIQATTRSGAPFAAEGRIVIGADGMHSSVARLTDASSYNSRPEISFTSYAYWSGFELDHIEICPRDYRAAFAWTTNDGLVLVGCNWPIRDRDRVRSDVERHWMETVQHASPQMAELVRIGTRESRWLTGSVANFFRTSFGPGWALVGDAGYKKDPSTAAGISDAFHDAQALADAVDEGLSGRRPMSDALADHQRRRDARATPYYEFTCTFARLDPLTDRQREVLSALRGNGPDTSRYLGTFAQTVPIPEFFDGANIRRIVGMA